MQETLAGHSKQREYPDQVYDSTTQQEIGYDYLNSSLLRVETDADSLEEFFLEAEDRQLLNEIGKIEGSENASDKQKASQRVEQLGAIVKHYSNHISVNRAIANYRVHRFTKDSPTTSLDAFKSEADSYPLLTKEDETELFTSIENGLNAINNRDRNQTKFTLEQEAALLGLTIAVQKVLRSNLRLVKKANARHLNNQNSAVDGVDYVQECMEGLQTAVYKFDINKGFKFSTYAMWWLHATLQKAEARYSQTIKIPTEPYQELKKIILLRSDLENSLRRPATLTELANYTGYSVDNINTLIKHSKKIVSLDKPVGEDNLTELVEVIEDDLIEGEESMTPMINSDQLDKILIRADLSDFQAMFLSLKYGLYMGYLAGKIIETKNRRVNYSELFAAIPKGGRMQVKQIAEHIGMSASALENVNAKSMTKLRLVAEAQAQAEVA